MLSRQTNMSQEFTGEVQIGDTCLESVSIWIVFGAMKLDEMEKETNIDWWEFQKPQYLEDRELYCLFAGYGVQYILLITILFNHVV